MEKGSQQHVVRAAFDVKSWVEELPSVASARPSHCPACKAASRPEGCNLVLWGHGTRERSMRGPRSATGPPEEVTLRVRRYLCCACGVTITVVPRGVAPRHLFAGFAIALAFALWGLEGQSPGAVREAVSPWRHVGESQRGRWRSLARWVRSVADGRIFPGLAIDPGPARARAARIAELAIGRAPPGDRAACRRHRAWRGGEVMA